MTVAGNIALIWLAASATFAAVYIAVAVAANRADERQLANDIEQWLELREQGRTP